MSSEPARSAIVTIRDGVESLRFVFASYITYIAVALLVAGLVESLARMDVFAMAGLVALYAVNRRNRIAMRGFLFLLVLSWVLDIVWLSIHWDNYGDAVSNVDDAVLGVRHVVVAVTIMALIFKTLVFFPAVRHEQQMEVAGDASTLSFNMIREAPLRSCSVTLAPIILILSFISSLDRYDMSCVPVICGLFGLYERNRSAMRAFFLFSCVSILVDCIWIGVHGDHRSFDQVDRIDDAGDVAFGPSIANMVLKVASLLIAYSQYREWPAPTINPEDPHLAEYDIERDFLRFDREIVLPEDLVQAFSFESEKYTQYASGLCVVIVILLQFVSLGRGDVFALVALLGIAVSRLHMPSALLTFICLLLLSIIVDMVWMGVHSVKFEQWSDETTDTEKFVLVFFIFAFILKIVLFPIVVLLHRSLPRVDPVSDVALMEELGRYPADETERLQLFRKMELQRYKDLVYYICGTQLVLFMLNTLDRCDPMGIGAFIGIYAIMKTDKKMILLYLCFMDAALLMDLLWLSVYGSSWEWFDHHDGNTVRINTEKFVFAISFLGAVLKLFAHFPTIRLYDDMVQDEALEKIAREDSQREEALRAAETNAAERTRIKKEVERQRRLTVNKPEVSPTPTAPRASSSGAGVDADDSASDCDDEGRVSPLPQQRGDDEVWESIEMVSARGRAPESDDVV